MPTLIIKVITQDGSNMFEQELEYDLDTLRTTPNPRQAIASQVITAVRGVVDQVDPSIKI